MSNRRGHFGRSSFARSFYTSDAVDRIFTEEAANVDSNLQSDVPPRSVSAAAAAAAPPPPAPDIHAASPETHAHGPRISWYMDALRQGSEQSLRDILQENGDKPDEFGDEQVLEQYRIMAQHEAALRVKENIGFDIEEYERTHKPPEKATAKSKKCKIRLPERTRIDSQVPPREEPPMQPPRPNLKLVQQKCKRVPDLCLGTLVRGSHKVPPDEHVVRCLGCHGNLRVKQYATLVTCPACNVTCPASSTRR